MILNSSTVLERHARCMPRDLWQVNYWEHCGWETFDVFIFLGGIICLFGQREGKKILSHIKLKHKTPLSLSFNTEPKGSAWANEIKLLVLLEPITNTQRTGQPINLFGDMNNGEMSSKEISVWCELGCACRSQPFIYITYLALHCPTHTPMPWEWVWNHNTGPHKIIYLHIKSNSVNLFWLWSGGLSTVFTCLLWVSKRHACCEGRCSSPPSAISVSSPHLFFSAF